jgi:8-amino-7-oxononanoate synthase
MEEEGAERRGRLMRNVNHFLNGLRQAGFDTGLTTTAIIPVIVGSDDNAIMMTDWCQRRGLFVLPILPPAVPQGTARLRLNVTCSHSLEDIDHALEIIKQGAAVLLKSGGSRIATVD